MEELVSVAVMVCSCIRQFSFTHPILHFWTDRKLWWLQILCWQSDNSLQIEKCFGLLPSSVNSGYVFPWVFFKSLTSSFGFFIERSEKEKIKIQLLKLQAPELKKRKNGPSLVKSVSFSFGISKTFNFVVHLGILWASSRKKSSQIWIRINRLVWILRWIMWTAD